MCADLNLKGKNGSLSSRSNEIVTAGKSSKFGRSTTRNRLHVPTKGLRCFQQAHSLLVLTGMHAAVGLTGGEWGWLRFYCWCWYSEHSQVFLLAIRRHYFSEKNVTKWVYAGLFLLPRAILLSTGWVYINILAAAWNLMNLTMCQVYSRFFLFDLSFILQAHQLLAATLTLTVRKTRNL